MALAIQPQYVVYGLLAFWLFAFGGAVGSFLNVVAYRLPMGMSLVTPGSHCPACKHPIRWFDNVPMLGWLHLRGRCRDCHATISGRYPFVEAITAGMFLLLGLVASIGNGINLPLRPVPPVPDATGCQLFEPMVRLWELCGICGYHLLLLCTLLAASLIEYDGHRVPLRLFGPAAFGGIFAPLAWFGLRPVPVLLQSSGWEAGLADGIAGAAAGAMVALPAWRLFAQARRQFGLIGLIVGPTCVGLFLGWQAAVVLTLLTAAAYGVLAVSGRWFPPLRRLGPTSCLAPATLAWILAWRSLVESFPGLG